jgi:hypothetical protein
MEHLLDQTAITYPIHDVTEMTGETIKTVLEDVCDNLFNADPYYQQGGDMVRVGGLQYTCDPSAKMGSRIQRHALERQAHRSGEDLQGRRLGAGVRRSEERRRRAGLGGDGPLPARPQDGQAGQTQPADAEGGWQESGDVRMKPVIRKRLLAAVVLACSLSFSLPAFAADWASGSTDWDKLPEIKRTRMGLYLTPQQAYEIKKKDPKGVAFFDIRTRAEAVYVGMPTDVDALVPYVEHQEIMTDWRRQAPHVQARTKPGLHSGAGAPSPGEGADQELADHPDLPFRRPQLKGG